MYPTLETIRQLAQTKEYRRIPLCRELYADHCKVVLPVVFRI